MFKTKCWLLLALFLTVMTVPALAQTDTDMETTTEAEQPMVKARPDAGPFAKGRKRVALFGGMGSTLGQSYLILGGGLAYFVADGLEIGVDVEGWLLEDPSFWKVTPQVRYTFFKAKKFKPYAGAFYRHTWIDNPFEDYDSWGRRAGVAYRQGGNYLALGVVHEIYLDCNSDDCSTTYPEISFWISF